MLVEQVALQLNHPRVPQESYPPFFPYIWSFSPYLQKLTPRAIGHAPQVRRIPLANVIWKVFLGRLLPNQRGGVERFSNGSKLPIYSKLYYPTTEGRCSRWMEEETENWLSRRWRHDDNSGRSGGKDQMNKGPSYSKWNSQQSPMLALDYSLVKTSRSLR